MPAGVVYSMGMSSWMDAVYEEQQRRAADKRADEEVKARAKAQARAAMNPAPRYCRYCNSPLGGPPEHDCRKRCPGGFGTCTGIVGHVGPCTDDPKEVRLDIDGRPSKTFTVRLEKPKPRPVLERAMEKLDETLGD